MKIANSLFLIGTLALVAAGCTHKTVHTSSTVPVYTSSTVSTPAPGAAPVITTQPSAPVVTSPETTYVPTGRPTVTSPGAALPGEIFNLHVEGLNPQDRTLAQQVLTGLHEDTTLSAMFPKVDINISQGHVILSGTVANEQQHQAVVNAIRHSAGNNNVVDQLQVKGP
jgi:hypothetical protein